MLTDVKQLTKFLILECVKVSLRLKLVKIRSYNKTQDFIVIKGKNVSTRLLSHHQDCTVP
jgi:hypothetical protein